MPASAPALLGPAGLRLWRAVVKAHKNLGPDGLRLLEDVCREADVVQRLEDALRGSDLMVKGSQGQLVASPLVSEVRQHRAVLAGLLKAMRLPATPSAAAEAEQQTSEKARSAARARWDARVNGAASTAG